MEEKKMNAAVSLLAALNVYNLMLRPSDEKSIAAAKAVAKRRKRPMIGRGNYGKNLMAHFDGKRLKKSKQVEIKKAA